MSVLTNHHMLPFITIATYNANSLSYHASDRMGLLRKQNISRNLKYLAKHNDIICIQETKLASNNNHTLSSLLRGWAILFNNFNSSKNGTLIALSPDITSRYSFHNLPLPPPPGVGSRWSDLFPKIPRNTSLYRSLTAISLRALKTKIRVSFSIFF